MRSALRATAPTAKSNWARAMRIVIPDSLASSRAHVAHGLLDHLRVDAARLERLGPARGRVGRSEEHTSELQSLMRISYAVFCLKNNTHNSNHQTAHYTMPSDKQ